MSSRDTRLCFYQRTAKLQEIPTSHTTLQAIRAPLNDAFDLALVLFI